MIQDVPLTKIRVTLEQPFSPPCSIGFNFVTLLMHPLVLETSPTRKRTDVVELMKENPGVLKSSPTSCLKVLRGHTIILETGKGNIVKHINSMGGTAVYPVPNSLSDSRFIALSDLCENIKIFPSAIAVVNSQWVEDCFTQQKRLPLGKYEVKGSNIESKPTFFTFNDGDDSDELISSPERDIDIDIPDSPPKKVMKYNSKHLTEVLNLPNFLNGVCAGFVDEFNLNEQK